MLLLLSFFLYLIVTVVVNLRLFNEIRLSKLIILLFITITAINILVVQSLHFVNSLNNSLFFLLFQIIICSLTAFLFIDPFEKVFNTPFPKFRVIFERPTWIEGFLAFLIIIILGLAFYMGTLSPINNSDSLHTHLPRIYYWLQHGSLENWFPTAVTQISYPINISLQGLWLFLLSGSEMRFFVAPWLALAAIAASIYEVAILLGVEKKAALTASLISLSFPAVLLQTYSYQGDAFVAALILCAIYFLLRFYKQQKKQDLYLSILLLVISLGSKQTAYLFVPVYFLALLLMFRKNLSVDLLVKSLILGLIFFVIFSSFKVIQNQQEKTVENVHMISPGYIGQLRNITQKPFEGYLTNGLRYLYQAISVDGLNGQLKLNMQEAKEIGFRNLSAKIGIDLESRKYLPEYEEGIFQYKFDWAVSEDSSWFGPFSYTVLPLAMIVTIFRRKDSLRKWYLLYSFVLLLVFIFGQVVLKGDGWGAYRGRHMTISALALAPLFSTIIPGKRIVGNLIAIIFSLAAFWLSISVLLINDNRPIITTSSLYTFQTRNVAPVKVTGFLSAQYVSRSEKLIQSLLLTSPNRTGILDGDYYDHLFFQDTGKIEIIHFVNKNIPSKEPLYTYMEPSVLEYALFGVNRSRALYPLESLSDLPISRCALISKKFFKEVPASFTMVDTNDEYSIYCNH